MTSNEDDLILASEFEKNIQNPSSPPSLKLDYTLQTPEERNELVTKIINSTPSGQLNQKYLEILSDYLIFAMDKDERKQKKILTDNRLVTVNKRETSYEGLCTKLENGEDGIYNLLSDLGKNTILTPKDPITSSDVQNIPGLKELRESIASLEEQCKKASGKKKYLLKKQIIEMRRDQYALRSSLRDATPSRPSGAAAKIFERIEFNDDITFDHNNLPVNHGTISFFNPTHLGALLCNYSILREAAYSNFEYDLWYLMEDLDALVEKTLKDKFPLYYDLLIYKIDGKSNLEIQSLLEKDHGIKHSVEYLSSLWRNKIPKLLADQAQKDYLTWYYTYQERGQWKTCTRCGQTKLAHNKFFSKNKSSKDGWYSLCKDCRNARSKKNMAKK